MRFLPVAAVATVMLVVSSPGSAQSSTMGSVSGGGTPISELLTAIGKTTKKKVLAHPDVQRQINVGDVSKVSYAGFLDILEVYGLVAIERGDTILVMPDAGARIMGAPLVSGLEKRPEAEVVTRIIHVKTMPAAQLVPILRPLIPSFGHLAASVCTNDLLLVDRFANARRVEAIVQSLDKNGEPYKVERCLPEAK